jgi:hypothetical protein
MTSVIPTHRSLVARSLQSCLDLVRRAGRSLRESGSRGRDLPYTALSVLDDATLRDLGMVCAEFGSYGAEMRGDSFHTSRSAAVLAAR